MVEMFLGLLATWQTRLSFFILQNYKTKKNNKLHTNINCIYMPWIIN